jgi:hypothetical protein
MLVEPRAVTLSKRHRTFVLLGLALTVAAWLAWSMLLVESDLPPSEAPPAAAN